MVPEKNDVHTVIFINNYQVGEGRIYNGYMKICLDVATGREMLK